MELLTRLKIVAFETVRLGAFVVLLGFLQDWEAAADPVAVSFSWVFWLVGVVIIVVGMEGVSLLRRHPQA